jgi:hypothetical protein
VEATSWVQLEWINLMPTIDLSDHANWASVTLAADEVWQARGGSIFVTIENPIRADQGFLLVSGAVLPLKAGQTVNFRANVPVGVDHDVILVREAI